MSSQTVISHHHQSISRSETDPATLEAARANAREGSSLTALPFDPLRVLDGLWRARWIALVTGLIGALGLGFVASRKLETRHSATAQLIKLAPQNALRQSEGGDPYTPHEVTIPNMIAMMWSGTVLEGASERLAGVMNENTLRSGLAVNPERNTDIIHVTINSDRDRESALRALDAYLDEVLEFTRDIQQHDAGKMASLLKSEISRAESEIDRLDRELLDYARREEIVDPDKQTDAILGEIANHNLRHREIRLEHETLDLRISEIENELAKVSPASARLHNARDELAALQLRYTDAHPTLQNAIASVEALEAEVEKQLKSPDSGKPPRPGENPIAESLYLDLVKLRAEKLALARQLDKLTLVSEELDAKLETLPRKSLELTRIRARRNAAEASRDLLSARLREALLVEESAEGAFRLLSKDRLEDVAVTSPTQKTVLAAGVGFAGGSGLILFLAGFSILLDRRIGTAGDLGRATGIRVLGKIESPVLEDPEKRKEWAFTNWTTLLPELRRENDDRAVVCGLVSSHGSPLPGLLTEAAARRGASALLISRQRNEHSVCFESALEVPDRILEVLTERPEKILHLHVDDDWNWNATERDRFLKALERWSHSEKLVVLVELSDPGAPETLLLAENLPNLIWIAKPGDEAPLLSEQTRLYRKAGCRLEGALLQNAAPFRLPLLRHLERFQKVTAGFVLAVASAFAFTTPSEAATGATLLGPGDKLNIRFIGRPELSREGVTVAPDGTLTYLQVQSLPVSGLGIDGLRTILNREMAHYYRNTRITVTPLLFRSQRVYVLGKIVRKGAITLDRPMRVTDVVAAAGGLETGLFQQNTVELADLRRSFLVRGGQRVDIDLEGLFLRGDMSQNCTVRSGDYLYFPSANSNEIHVFGNVKMQGSQGLLAHTSVHSAIAQAGGFTEQAFRKRILVIRGSLDSPQTFVVDMRALLSGSERGFRLEPKDIVYVADHPWVRAEELIDLALNTFCQGAVSAWAGANVGPFIRSAVLPQR